MKENEDKDQDAKSDTTDVVSTTSATVADQNKTEENPEAGTSGSGRRTSLVSNNP